MNAWSVGASAPPPELWGPLLKSAGMFCVVLGLLVGTLFVIKRYLMGRRGDRHQDTIKSITSYAVAPKSRLLIVDVQEERLLLGITPHQINFLTRLDSGKGTNNAEASYAENQAGFKKVLSQALEIGRKP